MKKLLYIFVIVAVVCFAGSARAAGFANETLHYVVTYKWGLIHKDAGEATLRLRNAGDKYQIQLSARTKPWADRFYNLRDTLLSTISRQGLKPVSYTRIAHEGGRYNRDVLTYSRTGNTVHAHAACERINKKGQYFSHENNFKAQGPAYDILSVFYYLRTINYATLTANKAIKVRIFSGSKVETLTVRSVGKEKIKLRNKSVREAYHIKFRFTTDGNKKSSEDISAWISTDPAHIPLQLVGSLPIGQIRCYYIP